MAKRIGCILLVLLLIQSGTCLAEYVSYEVFTVNGEVLTTTDLDTLMSAYLVRSLLSVTERGFPYDMQDSLTLVDALDKVLFDAKMVMITRQQAAELGISLTPEEELKAQEQAAEAWSAFLDSADGYLSRSGLEVIEPETFLTFYGLTPELLEQEARDEILDERLSDQVTAGMEDEEEALMAYVDWSLAKMDEAVIQDDVAAAAEVCLALAKREMPGGQVPAAVNLLEVRIAGETYELGASKLNDFAAHGWEWEPEDDGTFAFMVPEWESWFYARTRNNDPLEPVTELNLLWADGLDVEYCGFSNAEGADQDFSGLWAYLAGEMFAYVDDDGKLCTQLGLDEGKKLSILTDGQGLSLALD